MKHALIVLSLLSLPFTCYSNEYIVVNGVSKHVDSSKDYNESNYGLGYAWDTEWEWSGKIQPQVGFYKNSDEDWVAYATATKYFGSAFDDHLRFGFAGGVVVGYETFPVLPTIAFVVNGKTDQNMNINFLFTGYDDDGTIKPLIGVQFMFPF